MMKRALLLINPGARRAPRRGRMDEAVAWLGEHGWRVDTRLSQRPSHLTELARQAVKQQYDCVVACGGDGTLNEVANGLVGSAVPLAQIPAGTINVWAREAGLPREPAAALRLVEDGERLRIDTGAVDDRTYLLMASIGLDSKVVAAVGDASKRQFGAYAYLGRALLGLGGFRGLTVHATLDGEPFRSPIVALIAGNTRLYGGYLQITRHASVTDGLLDVCAYRGLGQGRLLRALLRTLLGRLESPPSMLYQRATRIDLETDRPWPVQADGEIVGYTPVTLRSVPRSLTVIIPAGRSSPLWSKSS